MRLRQESGQESKQEDDVGKLLCRKNRLEKQQEFLIIGKTVKNKYTDFPVHYLKSVKQEKMRKIICMAEPTLLMTGTLLFLFQGSLQIVLLFFLSWQIKNSPKKSK